MREKKVSGKKKKELVYPLRGGMKKKGECLALYFYYLMEREGRKTSKESLPLFTGKRRNRYLLFQQGSGGKNDRNRASIREKNKRRWTSAVEGGERTVQALQLLPRVEGRKVPSSR